MHADPNKPMELQKIKPPKKGDNIGTIRCFIAVIKERGWRALYTGFVLHQCKSTQTCLSVNTCLQPQIETSSGAPCTSEHTRQFCSSCATRRLRARKKNSAQTWCQLASLEGSVASWRGLWYVRAHDISAPLPLTSLPKIYPIDSAKSRYQRRVFSKPPGTIVHPPKLEWFSRRMYSGKSPLSPSILYHTYTSPGLGISILRSGVVNCGFFMLFEYTRGSIDELELDEDEIVYD
jgi:hypothetical protein